MYRTPLGDIWFGRSRCSSEESEAREATYEAMKITCSGDCRGEDSLCLLNHFATGTRGL